MTGNATAEQEIREVIERQAAAVHAKDVDALQCELAPALVTFDALPPLRQHGKDASRSRVEAWFESYASPIGYEVRDLAITAADDVAFAHYLYRVTGTLNGGETIEMWVRMALGLERVDGRWTITHEHTSVPFGPDDHEARLDLEP